MHLITIDGQDTMNLKAAGRGWWEKMEGTNVVIKIQS